MANDKPNVIKMRTPLGVAKFPKLTSPDYGTKDYPKPDGEYSVRLIYNENDADFVKFQEALEPHIAKAQAAAEKEFASLKKAQRDNLGGIQMNQLFQPLYDEEEEQTGEFEIKLATKAGGTVKAGPRKGKEWSRTVPLFDAKGVPIKGRKRAALDIWGGSELIVSFSFMEGGYFIPATGRWGLKLQIEAVQIVTLRAGGEKNADEYGFGAVEGGMSVDDIADRETDNDNEDEAEDYGRSEDDGVDAGDQADF